LPDNFNEVTNRFRPGAFSEIRESIPNNNDYFKTLLQTLRNIFNLTTAAVSDQNNSFGLVQPSNTPRDSISDILLKWVDPVQGTPTTISYVLNTYETVIKALQDSIQSTAVVNSSINEKGDAFATQVKTESTSKIIKLQKTFNSTVDFENEYLLEYLDHTRKDTSGFNVEGSYLYDVIKTDLISKKYDINSKNTTSRNLNEQNEAVFNKLNKIFSDSSELVIELFVEPPSQKNIEFSTVRDLQTSVGRRNINTFLEAVSDKSRDLSINDKRVLNTLLSTLISPTVDKSMKELEIVFDTSNDDNIYQKITPNSATSSGFTIFNLFKHTNSCYNFTHISIIIVVDINNYNKYIIN
jgi:NADH dehydrogenase/NADH:ubiquinone oxidoreductase subunit G